VPQESPRESNCGMSFMPGLLSMCLVDRSQVRCGPYLPVLEGSAVLLKGARSRMPSRRGTCHTPRIYLYITSIIVKIKFIYIHSSASLSSLLSRWSDHGLQICPLFTFKIWCLIPMFCRFPVGLIFQHPLNYILPFFFARSIPRFRPQ
jgi:hypothetical protein